ncbi:MAG: FMN-binding negative transcriptional regulator [Actinomycetota bacterium]|nr:FMN-binding negative transcriptional regulator [Actinomycetota bacterium]
MYIPIDFAQSEAFATELLGTSGGGDLVTATPSGLLATFLPLLYEGNEGGNPSLLGHLARSNGQWKEQVVGDALVIVRGPDGYVSPSWYESKKRHGRVVPTWNYVTAHFYGRLVVHDDVDWVGSLVRRLTDRHEATNPSRWSVDDAPADFVAGQLRSIVGVELVIGRVEAKAKLSQNRPERDVEGVVAALAERGDEALAEAVRSAQVHGRR